MKEEPRDLPPVACTALFGVWMPIQTAPKSRKAILVFRADNLCAFCAVWDDITNDWRHFGGSFDPIGGKVTHWMPLPHNPPNPGGLGTTHKTEDHT